jgi:catechol 2,3-dioxygenase-like lactoylglutathione lyase family enzyme
MAEPAITFHLSLNVSDLNRSIEFYEVLFDRQPAKRHDDYAKFELDNPPVVFSLVPRAPGAGGSLSHLGFHVSSPEEVCRAQERLGAAGLCTQDQQGTACGARRGSPDPADTVRQNKVWVKDPDGNFWEIYAVEEDAGPQLAHRRPSEATGREKPAAGPVSWEHFVTQPLAGPIPHADGSVDEVRLTGTFNAALEEGDRSFIVAEAFRVLRPGGKVVTHGLMADRALVGSPPKLPGLAALVARVPARSEVAAALSAAGFVDLFLGKLTDKPWFVHNGVGLREVKIVACKPLANEGEDRQVLYKGPFAEATVDGGWRFARGARVKVPAAVWSGLRQGPGAEQFAFFESGEGDACSGR